MKRWNRIPVWTAAAALMAGAAVPRTVAAAEMRFLTPAPAARFGLAQEAVGARPLRFAAADEVEEPRGGGPSPFFAGLMSAVVPGSGQLAMGKRRGWAYLGVETAGLFAVWALQSAGNQGEDDFRSFADEHWDWEKYESVTTCGDGLGPVDFQEEHAGLVDLYASDRDAFYDDIGDLDVYACGWDALGNRSEFGSMRARSDDLFRSARAFTTVVFLNHIISAIDAAKSAANRRSAARALRLDVAPAHDGSLALRLEMRDRF